MKVRKLPVAVEANRWYKNGDHPEDDCFRVYEDTLEKPKEAREGKIVRYYRTPSSVKSKCNHCGVLMTDHGWIDTLEGGHIVCPGDYIITGVAGEHYPIKESVFLKTYEII